MIFICIFQSTEEKPLTTKMMRDLEEDKKAMKYEQVVVRIKFKNSSTILQGFFRPKEPSEILELSF